MTQGPRTDRGEPSYHEPVLASEVAEVFKPLPVGVVVDATFGGGGHTRRLMDEMREGTRFIGIDRDPDALAHSDLAGHPDVTVLQGNFADLGRLLDEAGVPAPVGVLFDLGVSSHQLDEAGRGFSYHREGPIDMRMGPDAELSAAEIVNRWDRGELAAVIRSYGEERYANRIADAIVANRPIETTTQLAEVVAQAVPAAARRKGHPARRTFQALRIAVNQELEALRSGLDQAIEVLAPGGRCAVISYHYSRTVSSGGSPSGRVAACARPTCRCAGRQPSCASHPPPHRAVPRRDRAEPRARSARLRAAEKLERRARIARPPAPRLHPRLAGHRRKRAKRPSMAPWLAVSLVTIAAFLALVLARTALD